jgi:hypothetical protein
VKQRRLNAVKLVHEMSSERIGSVPSVKVVPDKRRKPPKHKKRGHETED